MANLPPAVSPPVPPAETPILSHFPMDSPYRVLSVRVPEAGEVVPHALSVPPGTSITIPGPPITTLYRFIAVLPDISFIIAAAVLVHLHNATASEALLAMTVVLAARAGYKVGDAARSGVLTILVGALGAMTREKKD